MKGLIAADKYWRLLGVGVDGFTDDKETVRETDFFALLEQDERLPMQKDSQGSREAIEKALDDMHAKFGKDIVFSGKQTDRLTKKRK